MHDLIKFSTRYHLDDQYILNKTLCFNFAQNVSTSTFYSINNRYTASSAIKTEDYAMAKEVVDLWFERVPQPKLTLEDFYMYAETTILKKLKDMVRSKEINSMKDLTDDEFENITNWFVKEQFKFDSKPQLKGAQGIIAWSKTKNVIYLAFVKFLEYYFKEMEHLYINFAKNTPERINAALNEFYVETNLTTCTDMSGFDKTQNGTTLLMEKLFYLRIAQPVLGKLGPLFQKYFDNRASYTVIGQFINFKINHIKASGEPGTIDFNTLVKKLQSNYFLDIQWDKSGIICEQGDDDMINKPHTIRYDRINKFSKYVTVDLKIVQTKIPEFAGKIISKDRAIPDVLRTALRFFAKCHTDYFRSKLNEPINNRFYTKYEQEQFALNSKSLLSYAIKRSFEDILDKFDRQSIEIANLYYKQFSPHDNLAEMSLQYLKHFIEEGTLLELF